MLYPKDPKVRVERHEKTLKIEWNWGGNGGYVIVVIALALLPLFWWLASQPSMSEDVRPLRETIASFLGFSGLICLPMIIAGLTSVLNRTMIHADHERFIVRVGPFPWVRPKIVAAKGIQQFFSSTAASNSGGFTGLYLIDGESHYIRLSSIFPSGFAVHQICHELQDWYGLEDLPIFGQNTLPHQPGPRSK